MTETVQTIQPVLTVTETVEQAERLLFPVQDVVVRERCYKLVQIAEVAVLKEQNALPVAVRELFPKVTHILVPLVTVAVLFLIPVLARPVRETEEPTTMRMNGVLLVAVMATDGTVVLTVAVRVVFPLLFTEHSMLLSVQA